MCNNQDLIILTTAIGGADSTSRQESRTNRTRSVACSDKMDKAGRTDRTIHNNSTQGQTTKAFDDGAENNTISLPSRNFSRNLKQESIGVQISTTSRDHRNSQKKRLSTPIATLQGQL
mmetsp:Transcript_16101/g.25004  ORF Transcript_16101/g.25004 Transcript_16101/m.25004 type:complete len:118 (+) Transcript_16101:103-456(+)